MKTCTSCGREVSILSRVGQRCPHCGAQWSKERIQESPKSSIISSILTVVIGLFIVSAIIYTPVVVYKKIKGRKKHNNISKLIDRVRPTIIENHIRKLENSSLLLRQDGTVIEIAELLTPNHNGIWLQTLNFDVLVFPSSIISIVNTNTKVAGLRLDEYFYSVTYLINNQEKTINAYESQRPRQLIEGKPFDEIFGERVYISFENLLYFENSPLRVISYSPLSNPIDEPSHMTLNEKEHIKENRVNATLHLVNGEHLYLSRFTSQMVFYTLDETSESNNNNNRIAIHSKEIVSIEFLELSGKQSDNRMAIIQLRNGQTIQGFPHITRVIKSDSYLGISEYGWCSIHISKVKRIEIELP